MATTELLKTEEAAVILGLNPRTLRRRVKAGVIPTLGKLSGPSGSYVFTREILDAVKATRR